MIRWICGVKPSDDPSMDELHAKLGICDLAILVRERRLRWFGHVMRSNGEINRVRSRPVPGRKGPGRPKKTWEECVKQDLKVCGLSEAGTQDRLSWRSSVKNSRQEPTPSNGSLPQSMAAPPARRILGMRTRSFNKTGFDWLIDWSQKISCQEPDIYRYYRYKQFDNRYGFSISIGNTDITYYKLVTNKKMLWIGLGRVPRAPEYSPGQTITRVANQHPGTPYRTGFPVLTLHTSAALLLMASVIPFHRYQPRSDQFITAKVKTGQSTSQLCEPPGPYKAKCLWTAPGWPVTGCAGPSHTSLLEIDVYGSLRPRPLRFLIGGRCG